MDRLLTDKHRAVQRSVRAFCERELRPIAAEIDEEARFPWEVVEKMAALGYFGIQAPASLGGAGLDSVSYAITIEEVSRVCGALGLCIAVHNSVAVYPLMAFGSEAQKERWVRPLARGEKIGAFCLTEPHKYNLSKKVSAVLMSPVFGKLENNDLAKWILDDGLDVRLQLQLHKYIWKPETRGV